MSFVGTLSFSWWVTIRRLHCQCHSGNTGIFNFFFVLPFVGLGKECPGAVGIPREEGIQEQWAFPGKRVFKSSGHALPGKRVGAVGITREKGVQEQWGISREKGLAIAVSTFMYYVCR